MFFHVFDVREVLMHLGATGGVFLAAESDEHGVGHLD